MQLPRSRPRKVSKDIGKIVHVTSVVQLQFYETLRILFVRKEHKNKDFIQQFLLFHVSLRRMKMNEGLTGLEQHDSE